MSTTLYKTLTEDLLKRIAAGDIKVGERFPPEAEYAAQLGVSRSTLRQAFALLEHKGILKRRKRGGTEVIAREPVKRFNISTGDYYDTLGMQKGTMIKILDIDTDPAEPISPIGEFDNLPEDWVVYQCVRFIENPDAAFGVWNIQVPKHFCDLNLQTGAIIKSVYLEIEKKYGVVAKGVKRIVSAEACGAEDATKIGSNEGEPVLTTCTEITDLYGEIIVIVQASIDPGKFRMFSGYVLDEGA